MEFNKEFLKEKIEDALEDNIVDTSRWREIHSMVFEHEGKYYSTEYSQGLTEEQDESPFEYADDIINCPEVIQEEVTIKKWVIKH